MCAELLSEEKYEELLGARTGSLTTNQKKQLEQIRKAGFHLNLYERELPDDNREAIFSMLREKQIEVLKNEDSESWEKFLECLPDVNVTI